VLLVNNVNECNSVFCKICGMSSIDERLQILGEIYKASLYFVLFMCRTSVSKYNGINNVSIHMTDES